MKCFFRLKHVFAQLLADSSLSRLRVYFIQLLKKWWSNFFYHSIVLVQCWSAFFDNTLIANCCCCCLLCHFHSYFGFIWLSSQKLSGFQSVRRLLRMVLLIWSQTATPDIVFQFWPPASFTGTQKSFSHLEPMPQTEACSNKRGILPFEVNSIFYLF